MLAKAAGAGQTQWPRPPQPVWGSAICAIGNSKPLIYVREVVAADCKPTASSYHVKLRRERCLKRQRLALERAQVEQNDGAALQKVRHTNQAHGLAIWSYIAVAMCMGADGVLLGGRGVWQGRWQPTVSAPPKRQDQHPVVPSMRRVLYNVQRINGST
jgi:hypothetical protein